MKETRVRDDEVLALRIQGKSFAGIARSLGFTRPSEANEAFNRALRRKPSSEQEDLRRQELTRLDALIEGVRGNAELAPDDVARRLRSVERLRTRLLAE
jgi:AraC-like DNA-binding protein